MNHFTSEQAEASKIVRMEKKMNGSTFVSWIFGIKDEDGNYQDWEDDSTEETADKDTIKSVISTYLQTQNKRPVPDIITYVDMLNEGLENE